MSECNCKKRPICLWPIFWAVLVLCIYAYDGLTDVIELKKQELNFLKEQSENE